MQHNYSLKTLEYIPGAQTITYSALKFRGCVSNIDEIWVVAERNNTVKYGFALNISVGIIITHANALFIIFGDKNYYSFCMRI